MIMTVCVDVIDEHADKKMLKLSAKSFYMTCDAADCVDTIDEHADKKMLKLSAKNEGWVEHDGEWYCPECAKKMGLK